MTGEELPDDAELTDAQRFQLAVSSIRDYAIYMLDSEGNVTTWNSGAERFKGYTEQEILGTHFSRFYTKEDRKAGVPARALRIAVTEGKFEDEGWRVRKDGSRFWASVVIDPITKKNGELIGFAKITRDVTEKREAAAALAQANAALFQSQKMEALGKLTGGVAHDFNNLLAVASSGIDVLTAQHPELQGSRTLESMRRAISRGANLTQQLLSFARQQPLQSEEHDLNALINDFESVLRRAGNSSIRFQLQIDSGVIPVKIDAARFETALLNLVVNASQAMPEGGQLAISTNRIRLKEKAVNHLAAGLYAEIRISDTGIGMTPDVIARAFEPFFTTKPPGEGTGLGLSQVYGFITQSEGDVVISSEAGVGSTFAIYLPLVESNAVKESNEARLDIETVLIVDDQLDLLEVTAELFRTLGYEALTATSGAEALAVLERTAVDILFSDVVMPNSISGVELARLTREQYPDTKIILASGYPLPGLNAAQGNMYGFSFLNKPYQLSDLARTLRRKA
ncbi:PAS domain S-box [Herbaspirillum sp. CF444]|uniref:PAS domain-containing sensor histidine kinase n=1 Tax=Herbaspirillum sp. CF444 TaxID=1144319 RepID=UPI0002727415|nr:PAS domain-containing sensor histidine kinase [Herbaspirillum sp. CF444]EJL84205.1 PAS domain S-box [Herbaspirillum sp. CF444]